MTFGYRLALTLHISRKEIAFISHIFFFFQPQTMKILTLAKWTIYAQVCLVIPLVRFRAQNFSLPVPLPTSGRTFIVKTRQPNSQLNWTIWIDLAPLPPPLLSEKLLIKTVAMVMFPGVGGCRHTDLFLLLHQSGNSDSPRQLQQVQPQLLEVSTR